MPEIVSNCPFLGTYGALEVQILTCYHSTNTNITSYARNFPELPAFLLGGF